MNEHDRQQKPNLDPATAKAFAETMVGNNNQPLEAGSWSLKNTRIISGNMFRLLTFGEQLKKHGVKCEASMETIKAAAISLSPEIPPYGLRGEVSEIMTMGKGGKKENEVVQVQPQQQGENQE